MYHRLMFLMTEAILYGWPFVSKLRQGQHLITYCEEDPSDRHFAIVLMTSPPDFSETTSECTGNEYD